MRNLYKDVSHLMKVSPRADINASRPYVNCKYVLSTKSVGTKGLVYSETLRSESLKVTRLRK